MTINGGCFCGAVRYRIEGKLRDARSCHCSMCRKAFSAQASAYALVEPDEFTWVSGEDRLGSYESGGGMGLRFCSVCGSTLCGTSAGKVHGVTLGCVDGDPQITLGMHIFVGSKAAWETIPEGVPQYAEWPPGKMPDQAR
ncbi:MAG: GFA family protein [Gammaproteobacteria bacterium]